MFLSQSNIELHVVDGGLGVAVKSFTPSSGRWSSLTEKQVISQLKKIGVRIELDHDLIHQVVAKAASNSDITGMTVLKGVAPKKKGDDFFRLKGNPDFPVFKGMVLGTLEKLAKDIPGRDVFNQEILPGSSQNTAGFKLGKGCVLDKETNKVLARGYAQVFISESELSLKPLFRLSSDRIKITSVLFPSDFYGRPITMEMMIQSLEEMQIKDSIDLEAIKHGLEKSSKTGTPQITIVAKGREAQNGRDGYFEPSEVIRPPDIDDSDLAAKIDFREQSIFKSVKAGTLLGMIHPPVPGQDGLDVFGKAISAEQGIEAGVSPGKNVEIDSKGHITALAPGMVVFEGSSLSVLDFTRINSDVDYSTGNIKLESGSVQITGSVKEGFSVKCPEHVLIMGNVEEARIEAGGNVEVSYGVVMKSGGRIRAGGIFRCRFAENAVIEAGGNVVFSSNLTNCRISTEGNILSSGEGIVMGGVLKAGNCVEVSQIGSEYGIRTEVYVGHNPGKLEKLIAEKKKLIMHHKEIKDMLVKQAMENKAGGLSPEQKNRARELMDTYNSIQNRIERMDRIIEERGISEESVSKYYVLIKNTAYPGTIISIAGKSFKVVETLHSPRFYFNYPKGTVSWS